MKNSVRIRIAEPADYPGWVDLYHSYAKFYNVPMNDRILTTLWGWIHDPDHEIECLLAFTGNHKKTCGLAHFRRMPSPLRGLNIGFLDDLYVDPVRRGAGIGKALFKALEQHARDREWPIVRWITADDNYRARNLYDQLSRKTLWNTYQMEIKSENA